MQYYSDFHSLHADTVTVVFYLHVCKISPRVRMNGIHQSNIMLEAQVELNSTMNLLGVHLHIVLLPITQLPTAIINKSQSFLVSDTY